MKKFFLLSEKLGMIFHRFTLFSALLRCVDSINKSERFGLGAGNTYKQLVQAAERDSSK